MTTRVRSGIGALAVLAAIGAAPSGALPSAPAPLVTPDGAACSPANAWISTARGDFWLTTPSSSCVRPAGSGWSRTIADGVLVSSRTPRLILTEGERVRIHLGLPPQSVVLAQTLPSARATSGKPFRLSPFAPVWKARRGAGVLTFSTSEIFTPPVGSGLPVLPNLVLFAAVYRTVPARS